jgi:excisionase family DNA binding protein
VTAHVVTVAEFEQLAARVKELEAGAASEPWPQWMSVTTASRYLDVSPERLRKLIARRQIPFVQEGRGCRVSLSRHDLDQCMRGQRSEGGDA